MIARFITFVIRTLIHFYQRILNPMLKACGGPGMGCRYHPTCSHYFLEAVETHGPARGSWMGFCRIFRCQPWGGSGYDPVPTREKLATGKHCSACRCDSSQS